MYVYFIDQDFLLPILPLFFCWTTDSCSNHVCTNAFRTCAIYTTSINIAWCIDILKTLNNCWRCNCSSSLYCIINVFYNFIHTSYNYNIFGPNIIAATRLPFPSILKSCPSSLIALLLIKKVSHRSA